MEILLKLTYLFFGRWRCGCGIDVVRVLSIEVEYMVFLRSLNIVIEVSYFCDIYLEYFYNYCGVALTLFGLGSLYILLLFILLWLVHHMKFIFGNKSYICGIFSLSFSLLLSIGVCWCYF